MKTWGINVERTNSLVKKGSLNHFDNLLIMCIGRFLFQSALHSLRLSSEGRSVRSIQQRQSLSLGQSSTSRSKASSGVHSRRVPCLVQKPPAINICRVFSPQSRSYPAGPKLWNSSSDLGSCVFLDFPFLLIPVEYRHVNTSMLPVNLSELFEIRCDSSEVCTNHSRPFDVQNVHGDESC